MLSPDDRSLFLHALQPPEGYSFDSGVGTTFTLDLFTLLVTPLSFALFECQSVEQAITDPLSLLEGLRRYAERFTVFCQAGGINLPTDAPPLMSYLEKTVVEVQAPRGGVFHPKFWLLRYTAPEKPVIYRLLNLSRNLTFDRSWDLILRLEGKLTDRKVGFTRNRPLSDFLQSLPGLAENPVSPAVTDRISVLQSEVRRVAFETIPGFANLTFHPFNIPGYRGYSFEKQMERVLVISPFLTNNFLDRLVQQKGEHVLVSQVDSLNEIKDDVRTKFSKIYILSEMAESDSEEHPRVLNDEILIEDKQTVPLELSGLHAKLIVWENGKSATWLIGSANATDAAFHKNVEFIVELNGRKKTIGIDTIIGEGKDQDTFLRLLQPYSPPDKNQPVSRDQKRAEELSNRVCAWLVSLRLNIFVHENNGIYDLVMRGGDWQKPLEGEYAIRCRPISLKEDKFRIFNHADANNEVQFESLSLASLTAFIGFEVKAQSGKAIYINRFVLLLPIAGLPEERDGAILAAILSDYQQFLRYLRLILMDERELASGGWRFDSDGKTKGRVFGEDLEMPLLEELVRAFSRSNEPGGKIDRISNLVERMCSTPEGAKIIPEEFLSLWETIKQARQEMD